MTLISEELSNTAHHEAGHAVLADLLYCDPYFVTIVPENRSAGRLKRRSHIVTLEDAVAELLVLIAGTQAESLAGNQCAGDQLLCFDEGDSSDGYRIPQVLQSVTDDPDGQETFLTLCEAGALRMLRNRPVWRAVETVAAALIERKTLDWGEVNDLIRGALGRSSWNQRQYEMAEKTISSVIRSALAKGVKPAIIKKSDLVRQAG
jgi:hypothetical protein